MRTLLLIGVGGMLGSIARYLTGQLFSKYLSLNLPMGTLVVNIIGAFLVGLIIGIGERNEWFSEPWHFFLAIGFCGSFTTFSTFAYENYELMKEGHIGTMVFYISISLIAGILFTWGGYEMSKWFLVHK